MDEIDNALNAVLHGFGIDPDPAPESIPFLISRGTKVHVLDVQDVPPAHEAPTPCYPRARCQKKNCQTCAQYRRFRVAERLIPKMRRKNIRHVVLTVPQDGQNLRQRLNELQRAFKQLTRLSVWGNVKGYLRVIHVEHGGNGWHPHLHAVVDGQIDPARLSDEWARLTGATETFVGVVGPTDDDRARLAAYVPNHTQDSFAADPDLIAEYMSATRGARLYSASGSLKMPTTRRNIGSTLIRSLKRNGYTLPICRASSLARRR